MTADVYSNVLDCSLHCCGKCKGLFSFPEEKMKHQIACSANPFKSPCTYFACERKVFLQLFQPDDFQVEGAFHPLNMSKDDSFINPFVKLRMPDIFDPSFFLRTPFPSQTQQPGADSTFLLDQNIDVLENNMDTLDGNINCSPDKTTCESFLNQPNVLETPQQIQNIINKNIEYLKSTDIPDLTRTANKHTFPANQGSHRVESPLDRNTSMFEGSRSRVQSPFEKHPGFLDDTLLGFGGYAYPSNPTEKHPGFLDDTHLGYHTGSFSYVFNQAIPFPCNFSSDLMGFMPTNSNETQSTFPQNPPQCPKEQKYIDIGKKDPFFGRNLGLSEMNVKDPFLITASVKSDPVMNDGIEGASMGLIKSSFTKSCEDIHAQVSSNFQLQETSFGFPSTLDEPTQLDYLDLATLDFLTNPNLIPTNCGIGPLREKGAYEKDDDMYSEDNFLYHEQASIQTETVARLEGNLGNKNSFEEPVKYSNEILKPLRLKKYKSDLGKQPDYLVDSRRILYRENLSQIPLFGKSRELSIRCKKVEKMSRKRKMSESNIDGYRNMTKQKLNRKRLCKSGKIFNVREKLTFLTEEQKNSVKAIIGKGDCIFVKKQIDVNKEPVVLVEDIPESIQSMYGTNTSECLSTITNAKLDEKSTFESSVGSKSPRSSHDGVKLTSVLILKCQQCEYTCATGADLKAHCNSHKTETELATESILEANIEPPVEDSLQEKQRCDDQDLSDFIDKLTESAVSNLDATESSIPDQLWRGHTSTESDVQGSLNQATCSDADIKKCAFEVNQNFFKPIHNSETDANNLGALNDVETSNLSDEHVFLTVAGSGFTNVSSVSCDCVLDCNSENLSSFTEANEETNEKIAVVPFSNDSVVNKGGDSYESHCSISVSDFNVANTSQTLVKDEFSFNACLILARNECQHTEHVSYKSDTNITIVEDKELKDLCEVPVKDNELSQHVLKCETEISDLDTEKNNEKVKEVAIKSYLSTDYKLESFNNVHSIETKTETTENDSVTDDDADDDFVDEIKAEEALINNLGEMNAICLENQVETSIAGMDLKPKETSTIDMVNPNVHEGYKTEFHGSVKPDNDNSGKFAHNRTYPRRSNSLPECLNVRYLQRNVKKFVGANFADDFQIQRMDNSNKAFYLDVICETEVSTLANKGGDLSTVSTEGTAQKSSGVEPNVVKESTSISLDHDYFSKSPSSEARETDKTEPVPIKTQSTNSIATCSKNHDSKAVMVSLLQKPKAENSKPDGTENNDAKDHVHLAKEEKHPTHNQVSKSTDITTFDVEDIKGQVLGPYEKDPKVLSCNACQFTTDNRNKYHNHMLKHTGVIYRCDYTGCSFKSIYKRNYDHHVRVKHTEKTLYLCEYCSHRTLDKNSLNRHINNVHLKEHRYKCTDCTFTAYCRTDVVKHYKNSHVQLKQFACNQCDFKTCYAHVLKYHLMGHAGIKPYKCSKCEYQVTNPNCVRRHIESIHRDSEGASCEVLDLSFEIDSKQFNCGADISDRDIQVVELSNEERESIRKIQIENEKNGNLTRPVGRKPAKFLGINCNYDDTSNQTVYISV